ncbi:hypothetical protein OSTOST_19571, partial [Ostertagia ostertagi]
MNTLVRLSWICFLYGIAADSRTPPPDPIPIGRDTVDSRVEHHHVSYQRHRHHTSPEERKYLRELEEYEYKRQQYRRKANEAQDQYFQQYLDRMRQYAAQIQIKRYQELLQRQQMERDSIAKTMGEFAVPVPDLPSDTAGGERVERPSSPFGDLQPVEKSARQPRSETSGVVVNT